jgi:superfamily II DNA/RNA helicase
MQERALAGVDIIAATPGRLMDRMRQQNADLTGVELLILDEADRMMDMGFGRTCAASQRCPPSPDAVVLGHDVDDAAAALEIVREPKYIQVGHRSKPARTISHRAVVTTSAAKLDWLIEYLRKPEGPVLVFSRTKIGAERLARRLVAAGIKCASLHADRTQDQRRMAVEGFRGGLLPKCSSRPTSPPAGLDIDGIHTVINFEMPDSPDAYVHRVGRTGRADEAGHAITLVLPDERHALTLLEKAVGVRIE